MRHPYRAALTAFVVLALGLLSPGVAGRSGSVLAQTMGTGGLLPTPNANTSDRMGGGGGGKGATGRATVKSSKSNTSDRMGGGGGGKGATGTATVKNSKSNTSDRMGGGGGKGAATR